MSTLSRTAMKLEKLVNRDNHGGDMIAGQGAAVTLDDGNLNSRRRRPVSLNLLPPTREVSLPSIHMLVNASEAPPPVGDSHGSTLSRPSESSHQNKPAFLNGHHRASLGPDSVQQPITPASPPHLAQTFPIPSNSTSYRLPTCPTRKRRPRYSNGTPDPRSSPPAETRYIYGPPLVGMPFSPITGNDRETLPYSLGNAATRPRSISYGGYSDTRHSSTPSGVTSVDASTDLFPGAITSKWQHHHYLSPSAHSAYANQLTERYTCPTCSKPFSRPSSLRIHSHSHTGEKPFVCPYPNCGKAFSVRSNMRRHERGCHGGA